MTVKIFTITIMTLLLTSCASMPEVADDKRHKLYPELTDEHRETIKNAKVCEAPGVPDVDKVGPDFAYGCFCGKSHPEYKHKSGTPYTELPLYDRMDLVSEFYGDEPIDDVDAACRDHDVCWIYNGEEDADCNTEFYSRMQQIKAEMQQRAARWTYDSNEARCAAFTDNISQIFATHLVAAEYDDVGASFGANVRKILLTPVVIGKVLVAGTRSLLLGKELFPRDGEVCRLAQEDEVLYPPVERGQPRSQQNAMTDK